MPPVPPDAAGAVRQLEANPPQRRLDAARTLLKYAGPPLLLSFLLPFLLSLFSPLCSSYSLHTLSFLSLSSLYTLSKLSLYSLFPLFILYLS